MQWLGVVSETGASKAAGQAGEDVVDNGHCRHLVITSFRLRFALVDLIPNGGGPFGSQGAA